ncbi:TPA: hypothetical protein DEP58_02090 [Patescibacteria group bacterium]|nr:MAG: hypothetical protein UU98_C0015G0006 [Parcubacteria group bacterium GW2011_GWD2_42_14]HCC05075.1 hypothetical protein [Patescibacteria group bacterium]
MFGNIRHLVALLLLVILGVGVYYLATSENFFTGHQQRASQIDQRTEELEREIIVPLKQLSSVNIDVDFFASSEYKALSDMSVSLHTPALVRSNPFAPVE